MFTGLLRHTATLRRRVAVLDGGGLPTYTELGQPITALVEVGELRCRIEPLTSKELAQLSQAGPVIATHRAYMAASAGILEADQLVHGTQVLEVQRIDDLGGSGRYLEVQAQLITSRDVPTS